MGERAVWHCVHVWGHARGLRPTAAQEKGAASVQPEGVALRSDGVEKRRLRTEIEVGGLPTLSGLAWAGEMRVGLIGQTRRVWASVGVKVVQPVEYQYQWTDLVLAVNGLTGRLWWNWTASMKSQALAPVVAEWGTHALQTLVWDRARGHGGRLDETIPVHRIAQPAYSPELHPAERVCEWLRSQIEGTVYGTLEAKRTAVERALHELHTSPERIQRLTGWMWIREALAGLPV